MTRPPAPPDRPRPLPNPVVGDIRRVPRGMERELTGATWNMLRGRNDLLAVTSIVGAVRKYRLDFVCLQEVNDYAPTLHRVAKDHGWQLIRFTDRPGAGDEAILIADDVEATRARSVRLSPFGWFGGDGQERPPLSVPMCLLDGWLWVGSIHQPPGTSWSKDGHPIGPGNRIKALRSASTKLVRFGRWHPFRDIAYLGDWNEGPQTRGRYSPSWIAQELGDGGKIRAPKVATHGLHPARPPIDYVVARGVGVDIRGTVRLGGDHRMVVARFRRAW